MGKLATIQVLSRFQERVRRDLETTPMTLDADTHRRRLAELLVRCGRDTHYELLGVSPGAGETEVHSAYLRLAREVHPDHADRLGLGGRQGVIEVLFERATEAYLVLCDPHRRSEYDRWAAVEARRTEEERREEARALTRTLVTRAAVLVEREEYHFALEILRQAVRTDPESHEAWALLGRVQARNPKWLHMAADSLRRAMELAPGQLEYRYALAEVEEERGRREAALRLYEQILESLPGHPLATEARDRLAGALKAATKKSRQGRGAGLFRKR